ncbi:MAG: apolipoprotein N-acyltransferase [Vulcanimicrobiota bacterium]
MQAQSPIRAVALVLLSVVLSSLAFPPWRWSWLAWVSLAPLLLALRGQGAARGAVLGALWGVLFELHFLSWAARYGWHVLLALLILRGGLWVVAAALVANLRSNQTWRWALQVAAVWTLVEYVGTLDPFGITWEMQANLLSRWSCWLPWVGWCGSWVLSWLLVGWNAYLVEPRPRQLALPMVIILMLACLGWLGRPGVSPQPPLEVGLIQVSLGQDVKWNVAYREFALDRLTRLTRLAARRRARLIVWPETSLPYRNFLKNPLLSRRVGRLAREVEASLMAGSIETTEGGQFNTASLFGPDGSFAGRYHKVRLAPCAEYLPGPVGLRKLRLFARVANYLPGQELGLFEVDGVGVGCLICYESMTPGLARQLFHRGARMLVVMTNDAPFSASPALECHFDAAVMRAAEVGLPVVQCANSGISGLISAQGEVLARTQEGEVAALVGRVVPGRDGTFYARTGDWFVWLALAAGLLSSRETSGSRETGRPVEEPPPSLP